MMGRNKDLTYSQITRDGGTGKAPRHVPYLKSEA